MPRHGTAIPETASPPEPVPASTSRPLRRSAGMSGWPIRLKLAALVAPPLLVILVGSALVGWNALQSVQEARRAQALAQAIILSGQANLALQEEINQAVVGAATGESGPDKNAIARLDALIDRTDEAGVQLDKALADEPPGGWSADAALAAQGVKDARADLDQARKNARTARSYTFAETSYQDALRVHLSLIDSLARDLTTATDDPRLTAAATTIAAMSGLADAAAAERTEGAVLLAKAPVIKGDKISSQQLADFLAYIATQDVQAETAQRFATPRARTLLNDAQNENLDPITALRADVVALSSRIPDGAESRLAKAQTFSETTGQRVQRVDNALTQMAQDTDGVADQVARRAMIRAGVVIVVAVLAFVLVVILATAISKTVTLPLRRLRSAAVEAATVRLPAAVRQIERQGPDAVPALPPVLPPGTPAGPETIEVAQAVDGLTTEALRLATAQVRLRQAIDEAFVSMSRRSQSMVEKQLTIIDELESTEEDPDQLRNLFRLDHLAARMRRYNDNLLVLAGSTVRTRSAAPVPVADIFRAATSEMEQYERVRLQPISGTAIAGPAAGGLIHLLAELLDNAAMYSPPTSPILLTAAFMPDGGLHLEVTDSGVGIPPNELAELNARLATPGTLDAQVPSRMGLFVVARLAQRGGLRVRLSPRSNTSGTVAEVMVPPILVAGGPSADAPPAIFGDIPAASGAGFGAGFGSTPSGPDGPGVGRPAAAGPGRSGAPASLPTAPAGPLGGRPVPAAGASSLAPPASTARPLAPSLRGAPGTDGEPDRAGASDTPSETAADTTHSPDRGTSTSTSAPGTPPVPAVAGGGNPLPSRRPGAVLNGGPLAAAAAGPGPEVPTPPPGSAGLFGVAAVTSDNPFEPVVPTGEETAAEPSAGSTGTRATGAPAGGSGPEGPTGAGGPRPAARGATAAWSSPSARPLPTRSRGTSMPPVLGTAGVTAAPGGRPAADSPTAVPPAPARIGDMPEAQADGSADSAVDVPSAPAGDRTPETSPERAAGASGAPGSTPSRPARAGASESGPSDAAAGTTEGAGAAAGAAAAGAAAAGVAAAAGGAVGRAPGAGPALPRRTRGATVPPPGPAPAGAGAPTDRPGAASDPRRPVAPLAAPAAATGTPPKPAPAQEVPPRLPAMGAEGALTGEQPSAGRTGKPGTSRVKPAAAPVPPVRTGAGNGSGPTSNGGAPEAWNPALPTELAARAAADAAAQRYRPANPHAPMIGSDAPPASSTPTPIFDSISAWFATDSSASTTGAVTEVERVVDLRDGARTPVTAGAGVSSSRWAALGDQQWLAASARAAANPEISGTTQTGLPMRRPGANLVPSATSGVAPPATATRTSQGTAGVVPAASGHRADPETVRGRLGSYQRGLTSARRSRRAPADVGAEQLFGASTDGNGTAKTPEGTGGDT